VSAKVVVDRKDIDFDWAYCELLSLEYDVVGEKLFDMYPEASESNEFVDEFIVASEHKFNLELVDLALEAQDLLISHSSSTVAKKISALADLFVSFNDTKVSEFEAAFVADEDLTDIEQSPDYESDFCHFNQLLPLFFSFNLSDEKAGIFRDAKQRDLAFRGFKKAIKDSGKTLTGVKKEYLELADVNGNLTFLAPFDTDFKLAEKRFNAGKNQYLTPEDIEDLVIEKEDGLERVEIEILRQSILDRQIFRIGEIVETSKEQADSLVVLGKARYIEEVDDEVEPTNGNLNDVASKIEPRVSNGRNLGDFNDRENEHDFVPADFSPKSVGEASPWKPIKRVSAWRYVQAWVLTGLLSGVATNLLDMALAEALLTSSNFDSSAYWIVSPLLSALVWLVCVIFIYSIHPNLMISKVVPWVWGVGTLGVLAGIGRSLGDLPIIFYLVTVGSYGFAFFKFGDYFKQKQPHRY